MTILLNELFGTQSRAGCSSAGPYGHRVLHIDGQKSFKFKERLMHGLVGLKPGWTRINFHYLMSDAEYDFIMAAICFVCEYGKYFLPLYEFEIHTGNWRHRDYSAPGIQFGLEHALQGGAHRVGEPANKAPEAPNNQKALNALYDRYLEEAKRLGEKQKDCFDSDKLPTTEKDLIPFIYV